MTEERANIKGPDRGSRGRQTQKRVRKKEITMKTENEQELLNAYTKAYGVCDQLQKLLGDVLRDQAITGQKMDELKVRAGRHQENLDRLQNALRSPSFKIAFSGGFSGGKSTLVNEIFGRTLMAEAVKPETANVAVVRKAASKNDEKIIVHYMTRDDFFDCVGHFCDKLGMDVTDDVRKLINSVEEEVKKNKEDLENDRRKILDDFSDLLNAYLGNSEKLGTEVEEIFSPEKLMTLTSKVDERVSGTLPLIKWVEVRIVTDMLTDYTEIIDLPGTDSTRPRDTRIAKEYLNTVDAVLVTTLFKRPLSQAESEIISLVRAYRATIQDKLFFVITQFDLATGDEYRKADVAYRHSISEIEKNFQIKEPRFVFFTSAIVARLLRRRQEKEELREDETVFLTEFERRGKEFEALRAEGGQADEKLAELLEVYYRDGGVSHLRKAMLDYFRTESLRVKLNDALHRVEPIHTELLKLIQPAAEKYRESHKNALLKAAFQATAVARESCDIINAIFSDLKFEDIASDRCEDYYGSDVAGPMQEAISRIIEEFDIRREIVGGGEDDAPNRIARKIAEHIEKEYISNLNVFLKNRVFGPVAGMLEKRGVNERVGRLFKESTETRKRYKELQEDFEETTRICLEARSAEEIRAFTGGAPKIQIPANNRMLDEMEKQYKEATDRHFKMGYNRVTEVLKDKCRDYLLYCMNLFCENMFTYLNVQKYQDEPEVLNINDLVGDGEAPKGAKLEGYVEQISAIDQELRELEKV